MVSDSLRTSGTFEKHFLLSLMVFLIYESHRRVAQRLCFGFLLYFTGAGVTDLWYHTVVFAAPLALSVLPERPSMSRRCTSR